MQCLQAVSVPTQAASAVQLACAKRAILCELVVCGKASPPLVQKLDLPVLQLLHFPKYTHSSVTRAIERNAQEYTKLAKAFEARDWTAVKAAEGKAEFTNVHFSCQVRRLVR